MVLVAIKPKRTALADKVERPPEKVGHQVGVAVALLVHLLEPVWVTIDIASSHRVLARKRRVPHNGVKAGVVAFEYLGELKFPVEGRKRRVFVSPLCEPTSVAVGVTACDRVGKFSALCFPFLRFVSLEERRQH